MKTSCSTIFSDEDSSASPQISIPL